MERRMEKLIFVMFCFLFCVLFEKQIYAAVEERGWQDEAIYFIVIDRFNNGNQKNDYDIDTNDENAYHGGDLQGIIKRLDYIHDMGFTAIWLTPIVNNGDDSYNGYSPQSLDEIEEHFGSMEEMKQLVKEAHNREMKVMVDLPIKQTDRIASAKWWVTQTKLDGFYVGALEEAPVEFWRTFAQEVQSVRKDFLLTGELQAPNTHAVVYEEAGIDGFFNLPYYKEITVAFSRPNQSVQSLYNNWLTTQQLYKAPYIQQNALDYVESKRFTRAALEQKQYPPTRLRLALAYLFTSPGIPVMYYGTEIALDGGEPPDNQRLMDFKTDDEFLKYISKLGALRQQLPSLRRGTFELLYEKDGMSVLKRTFQEETVVIAINNTDKTQKVHLTAEQLDVSQELRGLLEEDIVRPAKDGYYLVLDRETANVYALAERTGLNIRFISILAGIYILFILFLILAKRKRKRK